MGPSRRRLAAAFRHALATSDAKALDQAATELEFYRLGGNAFPEGDFSLIMQTIRRPEFATMRGAWTLLDIFSRECDALSPQQERRLLKTLKGIYPHLQDDMAYFSVCELLGRHFHNEEAYRLLAGFAQLKGEVQRMYVPDALWHMIRDAPDTPVARKAAVLLLVMREDPSPRVRLEACEAVRVLLEEGIDLVGLAESKTS